MGLALLLGSAAFIQFSKDPDRAGRRLALGVAALFAVALGVWIARGDLFRPSGLDSDGSGCGYERTC